MEKKVVVSLGKRKRFVTFISSMEESQDSDRHSYKKNSTSAQDKLPKTNNFEIVNFEIVLQMKNQEFDQFMYMYAWQAMES